MLQAKRSRMKSCNSEGGTPKSTEIATVGPAKIINPIKFGRFVEEDDAVLVNISRRNVEGTARSKKSLPIYISSRPVPGTRSISTPARPNARWSPAAGCARA